MRAAGSRCSLGAGWGIRVHNCGARHGRDPPTCRTPSTPARSSHADYAEDPGVLRADSFMIAIYRRRRSDALMAQHVNTLFLQRTIIQAYRVCIIRESRRGRFCTPSPSQTTNGPEASMRPGPFPVGLCERRSDIRVDATGRSRKSPLFCRRPSGRARPCGGRLCRAFSGTDGPSVGPILSAMR
jgi:hypothetical protein